MPNFKKKFSHLKKMNRHKTIDEYIRSFPKDTQDALIEMRKIIKKVAPDTTEAIAYGIPTCKLSGRNVVHFGGYKNHIGFYPTPDGLEEFKNDLKPYLSGKGTARFPLNKPLPVSLIKKIVKHRMEQTRKELEK